ncbi:cytochrome b/b6 domain-containing protein [Photobacterium sp. S4TG1]|uniref:cytochrome b/b6 domain-containing protein n=1 Tax=Photobacterium sp. S4TG1 TaxID=3114587 RepID=UPI002E16C465|nr:cytochrome b/b6 domain-containing protein [Photobacterium sp. S4TG1]
MTTQVHFPKLHRLIHWLLAFSILFILLTIFLRSTWMDKSNIAALIQSGLKTDNLAITQQQAITIAKSIRNEMFQWHYIVGYIVGILVLLRVFYTKKVGVFMPNPFENNSLHDRLQGLLYIAFYLFLAGVVITGLVIHFLDHDFIFYAQCKAFHKLSWWGILGFMFIHIGGVIFANGRNNKDTITKIING